MDFSILLYILAGAGILYLLVFFGLTRIKFFNGAGWNFFSYYRKSINEIPRAGAPKILKDFLIWRALKLITSLVIIIIVIGGFFAWQYFGTQKAQTQKTDSVVLRWDSQTDKILSILNEKFPECFAQLNIAPEVRIFEEADITGDEIPEALIWNGCTGAYTTHMILFQFIDGEPASSSFINENGDQLETEIFLTGSSVMNLNRFGLLDDLQGIYGAIGSVSPDTCMIDWKIRAFGWDSGLEAFRLNKQLSQKVKQNFPQYFPSYFDTKQGPVSNPVKDCSWE